ncbi:hypothetical protein TNCV_3113991 [Trichonephila clavipes]|nr:hypothetical protein TNCV_3113991 [Trichonephila clavipes]
MILTLQFSQQGPAEHSASTRSLQEIYLYAATITLLTVFNVSIATCSEILQLFVAMTGNKCYDSLNGSRNGTRKWHEYVLRVNQFMLHQNAVKVHLV